MCLLARIKESIVEERHSRPSYRGLEFAGRIAFIYGETEFDAIPTMDARVSRTPDRALPLGIFPQHLDFAENQLALWRELLAGFVAEMDIAGVLRVAEALYVNLEIDNLRSVPFYSGLLPWVDEHYGDVTLRLFLRPETYERYLQLKSEGKLNTYRGSAQDA